MIHLRTWGDKWYKNLIALSIENPFKTWWKAKKYFKFPDVAIKLGWDPYRHPYASSYWRGKILDINIYDLYWKDKYNSPRHERDPLIYFCLFSRISLWIIFGKCYYDEFGEKQNGSMEYWEYILKYLYYSKNKNLRCYSCWTTDSKLYRQISKYGNEEDGSKDEYKFYTVVIPVISMSLNKSGIKKLKEQLKQK